jgi:hypothetical protein
MARELSAMGRRSPCAITRCICWSGSARTQTVMQEASNKFIGRGLSNQPAAGREHKARIVMQHGLKSGALGTAEGFLAEHFDHFAKRHAAFLLDDGRVRQTGISSCSARRPPIVDLPPPRRPTARRGRAAWRSTARQSGRSATRVLRRFRRATGERGIGRAAWLPAGAPDGRRQDRRPGTLIASAIRRSNWIEQLPSPASSWARYRSDTSEWRARTFRDIPRRLRIVRTFSPIRRRKGSPASFALSFIGPSLALHYSALS